MIDSNEIEKRLRVSSVTADVLEQYEKGTRNFALEGSTRSTKTWTFFHLLNLYGKENEGKGKRITIARDKRTWIKDTIYKDLNEFVAHYGMQTEIQCVNISELIYNFYGNELQLIGLDDPMKVHGRKQDVLWVNEVMEADYNIVKQMMGRTSEMVLFDWNPSQLKHWVFDTILPRPDFYYQHSTYKDNPFLPDKQKHEIEITEPTPENIANGTADEYYWKVYGLGVRAGRKGVVYPRWSKWKDADLPLNAKFHGYGVDFGFSTAAAAVAGLWESPAREGQIGSLYFKEFIYVHGMVDAALVDRMLELKLDPKEDYCADCAEPKAIAVLRGKGFRVHKSYKPGDARKAGIKLINSHKIFIHENSANMQNEITSYSYKLDIDGEPIDDVVKKDDHLMDAMRYITTFALGRRKLEVY